MSAPLPPDSLAFAFVQAARIVAAVQGGQSLAEGLLAGVPAACRPQVQDMVYGCLRAFGRAEFLLARLLDRPLAVPAVCALLQLALHRLENRPGNPHTVVDQAVEAAGCLSGGRFKGLANAVLRNFLRRQDELQAAAAADETASGMHPAWWRGRLRAAYPGEWEAIVAAGNSPPPMALRVNRRRQGRDDYLGVLAAAGIEAAARGADGVLLARPLPVDRLPGFAEGSVSIQDLGAQRAAFLLAPQEGSRVLDACAAPGGKTAHLLEGGELDLLALDLKPARCRRIGENLDRLGLHARVQAADCCRLEDWWDGRPYDAVLADVPCTASGVVRRHPDAKYLRRDADVDGFARTQARILDVLWQVVRPGGKLLYATCSLFPEENSGQIESFLARQPLALRRHQEQLLPDREHDGFYYCLLEKQG